MCPPHKPVVPAPEYLGKGGGGLRDHTQIGFIKGMICWEIF